MAQNTAVENTVNEPGALISFLSDQHDASLAEALAWEKAASAIEFVPLAQAS